MASYKGLTLEEIIDCFTDPSYNVDSQLLNIVLYTYRNYCDALDIIKLINKRFKTLNREVKPSEINPKENEGYTKAVIFLLNSWLMFPFAFDFHELPDYKAINYLLQKIRSWPRQISFIQKSESFKESFRRVEDKVNSVLVEFNKIDENRDTNYRELPVDCSFAESFCLKPKIKEKKFNESFLDCSVDLIASCLTYIDQKVLRDLKLQEMLSYTRKKPAPSVTAIIDKYNQLYNVVCITINEPSLATRPFDIYQYSGKNSPVSHDSLTLNDPVMNNKRTDQVYQVIDKWIQIAQKLSEMRNFSSLMAIFTALDNPSNISIMKKTSKLYNQYQLIMKVNEPHINQNKEHKRSSSNNSSTAPTKTRNKLKMLKILYSEVPYLGTYLKNLTYIDDGFPDFLKPSSIVYNGNEERLINLEKCRRQFDVLVQVKLCISALKGSEIKSDDVFLNWYSEIQRQSEKSEHRNSYSGSILSLESTKSDNSGNSDISSSSVNQYFSPGKINKQFQYKSHQSLTDEMIRNRSKSSPIKKVSTVKRENKIETVNCKVATVKLKLPKHAEIQNISLYRSTNYNQNLKAAKKPETISNAVMNKRDRLLLPNLARSSSTVNKDENGAAHLENIHYKKIQINEKEHTTDFIERVLKKFCLPDLDPSNFEVIQILVNNKEILIPENANLFYALAKQDQYFIEVQPKRSLN